MTTIRTLLVANRGEIARRVVRSARGMGIRTVAVFSDPDADAPHVADADVAVPLGGTTSGETYLDIAKILDAVKRSGADAVHPGYGFLSENADFADACAESGVLFVGPAPEAIRSMGLKDRAKQIARTAGVPVLPDALLTGDTTDEWHRAAVEVGYPLLVKATAGGGGKGMRLVHDADHLADAVRGARREAGSSFGNAEVFAERYLPRARHIEIQVFGDRHGNAIHLGERECSVQRRHQKVLEEAPSPAVDAELRNRMGQTAVALVRELGYLGAGTVEYLLDEVSGQFYFLEMNTRLQVEHPVTEEVTGCDLVRMQLQIAQGEPLSITQDDIAVRGHAIEVRLYAEDPARDFLPTPGRLHHYAHPHDWEGLRFEDGVAAPCDISPFYDPLLAKVIAHAPTRAEAAARLAAALDATEVYGTTTNREFLAALLRDPDFRAGDTHTGFLADHPALLAPPSPADPVVGLAAAVAVTAAQRRTADAVTGAAPPGFRLLPGDNMQWAQWEPVTGAAGPVPVGYQLDAAGGDTALRIVVDGREHRLQLRRLSGTGVDVIHDGVQHRTTVTVAPDDTVWVHSALMQSGWRPVPRLPAASAAVLAAGPVATLPGTVVAVLVEPGQRVTQGEKLVVVEAMKMEHPAHAEADGVVEQVHVEVGQYVEAETVLVTLATHETEESP
ncbi:ATP-binding protein [Mycolicibacterium thermoresistibile]